MSTEHSDEHPDSALEFIRADLRQKGYREIKEVLPVSKLKPREFRISPHYHKDCFQQTVNQTGKKVWWVSVCDE